MTFLSDIDSLDPTLVPGQAGHIADHERLARIAKALPARLVTSVGSVNPEPTLPAATEYVWFKTNGTGTLLDILSGKTA